MATNIPPHNAAELCDAALHLLKHPNATLAKLMEFVPGPDFPTGGIIVSSRETLAEAYRTGRGGIRVRARWGKEDQGRGTWSVVITEIPYQVQKSRLIEAIAGLIEGRKLPLVADIRDESAEDIRIVVEPRARNVDPALMMESLFRTTELESRFSLNMNVLSRGQVPNVLSLREVLIEWLDHRKVVLVRRTHFRLGKIAQRLEVLGGYLVAYLNLDEVIRIIREEDEPKAVMMARWDLTDYQVEAILNMRLGAAQARRDRDPHEFDALTRAGRSSGLVDRRAPVEVRRVRDRRSAPRLWAGDALGRRRPDSPTRPTSTSANSAGDDRARAGHVVLPRRLDPRHPRATGDLGTLTFKEGDRLQRAFHARPRQALILSTGASSSRLKLRSSRAVAATASPSGLCSIWTETRASSRFSSTSRAGGFWSPRPAATALLSRSPNSLPIRARASRS
jgi:topoisomerase-4 subunit A